MTLPVPVVVRSTVASCIRTNSPVLHRFTSISTIAAPFRAAASMAGMVFSGNAAASPLCAHRPRTGMRGFETRPVA